MPTPIIFWDEDTQHDFMDRDGALYVPGAEQIIPNLEALTRFARVHHIRIVAVMCDHTDADAEISATPDFQVTFPPHCMRGTRGQERIDATAPRKPRYIENRAYRREELERLLKQRGEIVLKKQTLDPFSNPATVLLLEILGAHSVVVYGVATDFCVHYAIMGLSSRVGRVHYVHDACRAISNDGALRCEAQWRERGVEFITTADVLAGRVVPLDREP